MEIVSNGVMVNPFQGMLESLVEKKRAASPNSAPHERADLVNQFVLGLHRTATAGYKRATFAQINGQLRYASNHDLYVLLKECEKAKNFGAFFWWKLKQSKKKA